MVEQEKIGSTMPTVTALPDSDKPKLLDQVREVTRRKHYSTARPRIVANHVTPAFARADSRGREVLASFRMTPAY